MSKALYPVEIYDQNLNKLAEIEDYLLFIWWRRWRQPDAWQLVVNRYSQGADRIDENSIIVFERKEGGVREVRAGRIEHFKAPFGDGGKASENWHFAGHSKAGIFDHRVIQDRLNHPVNDGYDVQTGPAETVMRHYVNVECISPRNPDRRIPGLVLSPDRERGGKLTGRGRLQYLSELLESLCIVSGLGYDVEADLANKNFPLVFYEGRDLTPGNSDSPVTFSAEFANVKTLEYNLNKLDSKNFAVVAGQGEGHQRKIVPVYFGINARFEREEDWSGNRAGTIVNPKGELELTQGGPLHENNFTSTAGLTSRWTSVDQTIKIIDEPGATEGKALEYTTSTSTRRFLSWDIGSPRDVILECRCKASANTFDRNMLRVRASGGVGTETGYTLELHDGNYIYIRRYTEGLIGKLATKQFVWSPNVYYRMKLMIVRDNIRAKAWRDGDPEPENWLINIYDEYITDGGWVGIGHYTIGTYTYDWLKVQEIAYSPGSYESPDMDYSTARIVREHVIRWTEDRPEGTTLTVKHRVGETVTREETGAALATGELENMEMDGDNLVLAHAEQGELDPEEDCFESGHRLAPSLDLTPAHRPNSSRIEFDRTLPEGTTLNVYAMVTSGDVPELNDPGWKVQTHSQPLSVIVPGENYAGKRLWLKVVATTVNPEATPALSRLYVQVGGVWLPCVNGEGLPGVNVDDDLDGVKGKLRIELAPGNTPLTPVISPPEIAITGVTTATGPHGEDVSELMVDARDIGEGEGTDELVQRGNEKLAEYGIEESFEIEALPGPRTRYVRGYEKVEQKFRQHQGSWLRRSYEHGGVELTPEGNLAATAGEGYNILKPYQITKVEKGTRAVPKLRATVNIPEREETRFPGNLYQIVDDNGLKLAKETTPTYFNWADDFTGGTLSDVMVKNGLTLPNRAGLEFGAAKYATIPDAPAIRNIFDGGGCVEVILRVDEASKPGDVYMKYAHGIQVFDEHLGKARLEFWVVFDDYWFGQRGRWQTMDRVIDLREIYRISLTYNSSSVNNNPTLRVYDKMGNGGVVALTRTSAPSGTRSSDEGYPILMSTPMEIFSNYFYGTLSDLRFWSTIPSGIDGRAWTELTGNEPGLAGNWKMDEGQDNVINDSTANKNHGSRGNASWTYFGVDQGYRIIDIPLDTTEATGSLLTVNSTEPAGSAVKIYAMIKDTAPPSADPGWAEQTRNAPLTVITPGGNYKNKTLWLKEYLITEDEAKIPVLHAVNISIDGQETVRHYPDGYRICQGMEVGKAYGSVIEYQTITPPGTSIAIYAMTTAGNTAPGPGDPGWKLQSNGEPLTVITPEQTYGYLWTKAVLTTTDPAATPILEKTYIMIEAGAVVRASFGITADENPPDIWYPVPSGSVIPFIADGYEILNKYLWAKAEIHGFGAELIDMEILVEGKNAVWGYRRGSFTYLEDYRCGDIVHAEHKGVASMCARIVEVKEEYTPEQGECHTITLGREKPDLVKLIRTQGREIGPEMRR